MASASRLHDKYPQTPGCLVQEVSTSGRILSRDTRDILCSHTLPVPLAKYGSVGDSASSWLSLLEARAQAFMDPSQPVKLDFALSEANHKDLVHTSPPVTKKQQRIQMQMVQEATRMAKQRLHEVCTPSLKPGSNPQVSDRALLSIDCPDVDCRLSCDLA